MSYKILDINIPVLDVGQLEVIHYKQENYENSPVVILFPPNPKHNATMHNSIIKLLTKIYLKFNFDIIKFNYRGVGKSQGVSYGDYHEINDGISILDWYLKKNEIIYANKTSNIWLAGYGFGAYIALQIAMRRPEITGFNCLSLPINLTYDQFNLLTPFPNGLIIHGDKDLTCDYRKIEKFYNQLIPQENCIINFIKQDNDHYFKNRILLEKDIVNFLSQHYNQI